MFLQTKPIYFQFLLIFLWKRVQGNDQSMCQETQLMIGRTPDGQAIIAHFPSARVGETSESLEKCSQTSLPLATVKCIKLSSWMIYDTFNLNFTPCIGTIYHNEVFHTSMLESTFAQTTVIPKQTSAAYKTSQQTQPYVTYKSEMVDTITNILTEVENITTHSTISTSMFCDLTKRTDAMLESLFSSSALNQSSVFKSNTKYQSTIIKTLDLLVSNVELPMPGTLRVTRSNFVIEIHDVELESKGLSEETISFTDQNSSLSFDIPMSSIKDLAGRTKDGSRARVGFVYHKNSHLFPSSHFRANQVISASVNGTADNTNLLKPITFTMKKIDIKFDEESEHLTCGYWDFKLKNWSEEGCRLHEEPDKWQCQCNHLTNFAILMDLHRHDANPTKINGNESVKADFIRNDFIGVISDVGCILSICGLLLTLVIHMSFANLRKRKPQKVLIHLSFSLLFAYLVFLMGVRATEYFLVCALAAAFLHYFWLCAWCWMAIEGYTIYGLLVKVNDARSANNYTMKASLFAYGIPAVIVVISAILSSVGFESDSWHVMNSNETLYLFSTKSKEKTLWQFNIPAQGQRNISMHLEVDWESNYIGSDACWPWGPTLYFGFLLPVGLIFAFNAISFGLVLYAITKGRNEVQSSAKKKNIKQQLSNAMTVTALLGISWFFGFLAMASSDSMFLVLMEVMHACCNSTQGFSLFIFFCVRHPAVRATWQKWLRRRLPWRQARYQTSTSPSPGINKNETVKLRVPLPISRTQSTKDSMLSAPGGPTSAEQGNITDRL